GEGPATASGCSRGDSSAPTGSSSSRPERQVREMAGSSSSDLCLEGTVCDVTISVDGVEFDAHKTVLCSCSDYF
ncbi:unnamed protein product, partial [Bubo scandiacus]